MKIEFEISKSEMLKLRPLLRRFFKPKKGTPIANLFLGAAETIAAYQAQEDFIKWRDENKK
jgi:hypothetical protein